MVLKENLFRLLLKIVRNTLFKKRTTAIGQRLSSTLNRTGTSEDLEPSSRMGVRGWKITKRKHQG